MGDMFLSPEELQELTCRIQHAAQVRVLRGMGIEHRVRPDGTVAVMRAHVEKVFGAGKEGRPKTKEFEPDWGALAEVREKTRRPGRG